MKNIPIRNIEATQTKASFTEHFSIRSVESLLAGETMVQALHRHDFFYLLALQKGIGKHSIDFNPYTVCNHSVFFMRPGQVHELTLEVGSTGYLVAFDTNFYHPSNKESIQFLRKASSPNAYTLKAAEFQKLQAILRYLFQEYTCQQEGHLEVIKANLGILFIELVRQHPRSLSKGSNPYAQEQLEKLLELLETHIANHKQVSQYADMLHLSLYQLNAITKATLNKTCSELINEHIILEAKRYLLATSNQVNQIAYHLGYEDTSYFIRFFKKHTHYSPEAFRNNFR